MNRLGAALLGEAADPPIKALYVFGANPAAVAPNAGAVVRGLQRDDLFTVVHELFMTDTADYADIILPATSQLEQTDLHKAYGTTLLAYNAPAIPPLGEARSNWAVMCLLAAALGFGEPWLQQDADEVIAEVLAATAAHNPALAGITLADLRRGGALPLALAEPTPFAGGEGGCQFPTPSGQVELFSEALAALGLDPLPGWAGQEDDGDVAREVDLDPAGGLYLISSAAHHFVTSSFANQPALQQREGEPFVEIHPVDAAARGIRPGDRVIVANGRGWCALRAVVTEATRPGCWSPPRGAGASCTAGAMSTGPRLMPWATWAGKVRFTATGSGCAKPRQTLPNWAKCVIILVNFSAIAAQEGEATNAHALGSVGENRGEERWIFKCRRLI